MREMWQTYGKREKSDDLHTALTVVTSQAFADEFFASYIDAAGLPDYAALLAKAGLVLRKAHPGKAWLGPASLEFEGKDAVLDANTTAAMRSSRSDA